jgi:CO/xanthine dehydrogenase FAD-binding subunit
MRAFQFKAVASPREAISSGADTAFIAGGTNLIDLMKLDVLSRNNTRRHWASHWSTRENG